ncbi:DUF421 domain-containing protein [Clostridium zeae]|uniref:DUF421 domain-containing protein n=1 Tax=Clostridium zeae TaxID=2759022 RepID=A0ABQ1EA48_9CLOT|nr:DUF421 domain-containing protein [Clostridium zeae]GFZ31658.1 DUF421 domain-containing protein [Clostridium zeae]
MLMILFHFLFKPLVIFFVLLMLVKVTGKKSLSQITYFDYISGITIGAIAGAASIDKHTDLIKGIIVLMIWIFIPMIMSYIEYRSFSFERKTVGEPLFLIKNGVVATYNLKKAKYSINDLLMQLRKKDVFDLTEVEFAILEVDGTVSVLKKAPYSKVTPQDLNINPPYKGLTLSLIINGIIVDSNLHLAEKDKAWLEEEIKKNNITNIEDVLYAGYTSVGKLELVTKNTSNTAT